MLHEPFRKKNITYQIRCSLMRVFVQLFMFTSALKTASLILWVSPSVSDFSIILLKSRLMGFLMVFQHRRLSYSRHAVDDRDLSTQVMLCNLFRQSTLIDDPILFLKKGQLQDAPELPKNGERRSKTSQAQQTESKGLNLPNNTRPHLTED